MRFANIMATLGGVVYANSGLECTTMLGQGIGNADTLNVTQDTTCNGSITLSNDLASGGKITRTGADAVSSHGSGNLSLHKPAQFPNGFTATSGIVSNQVAVHGLNTPAINRQNAWVGIAHLGRQYRPT